MSQENYASWSGGDVFTIRMKGTCAFVQERLLTLVEDFLEPKFGYNGEQWDEE